MNREFADQYFRIAAIFADSDQDRSQKCTARGFSKVQLFHYKTTTNVISAKHDASTPK